MFRLLKVTYLAQGKGTPGIHEKEGYDVAQGFCKPGQAEMLTRGREPQSEGGHVGGAWLAWAMGRQKILTHSRLLLSFLPGQLLLVCAQP